MKKVLLLSILAFAGFNFNKSFFGYEQINAYYNKEKVGHWILNKTQVDKLILNYHSSDTLLLAGFCDSGCLDGTILKITEDTNLVATVTRRSPILHGDSIMSNYVSEGTKRFHLDNGVSFKITGTVLSKLVKHKVYRLSFRQIIDKNSKDIPIFDLELR